MGLNSDCIITVTDSSVNLSRKLTLSSFFEYGQMGELIQGIELSLSSAVSTLSCKGSSNYRGTSANFNHPLSFTKDRIILNLTDWVGLLNRKIE